MDEELDKLIQMIDETDNIVFFGGAGVSTESGIPDFRSKDGLYNQHDIQFEEFSPEYLLSNECLFRHPKVFYEFYRQKLDTREIKPNTTHYVLAKLEKMGKIRAIVTQNIDGLHQQAGSENVYEIHGTTARNYCAGCGKEFAEDYIFNNDEAIPLCPNCRHQIRPDVVLYGEQLPDETVMKARKAIKEAELLIVGGTSLKVYPASGFIYDFAGKHMAVINKEKLDVKLDPKNDVTLTSSLGEVFTEIDKRICR